MKRRPKYLSCDRDRHGNTRWYVRKPGAPKIRIRADYDTPEFWRAYADAIAGKVEAAPKGPARREYKAGSIGALIKYYRDSSNFRALNPKTQKVRGRILERLELKVGQFAFRDLRRRHLIQWRDAPEGPEAGNAIIKALRQVFDVALEAELISDNPAQRVKYRASNNPGGHAPWTEADVRAFLEHHAPGTMARLALMLFLYTGGRISDVHKLGPQHVRDGWIVFAQTKNAGRKPITIEIKLAEPLRAAIEAVEKPHLAFLTSEFGRPFASEKSFANRFKKWALEAGVDKPAHGLRKFVGSSLAEAGCSPHEIQSVLGHTTLKEAARYSAAADRRRLGGTAMDKLAESLEREQIVPPNPAMPESGTKKARK